MSGSSRQLYCIQSASRAALWGNSFQRFKSISLLIRLICWSVACSSSSQHAGAAQIAVKKRIGQSKQVTTQQLCDSVVVGGTILLSDWAAILSVPLTSSWIYSDPTVYHCSVYSTGMWQELPKAFSNHMTSVTANSVRWRCFISPR